MGIKGKTTFELTDVNTGEVEKYTDTNMVTNALQNFLHGYGVWCNTPLMDYDFRYKSFWYNLLGGLFLFDNRIEENANNIFMPAGVGMVGNACVDVAYTGDVLEIGNYNTEESGVQDDGSVKFVYDFSTSQANGNISCACLTSRIGGYIGMGNACGKLIYNTSYFPTEYQDDSNSSARYSGIYQVGTTTRDDCIAYLSYEEDAIYMLDPANIYLNTSYAENVTKHWSTTQKINLLKVKAGFKNIDISGNRNFSNIEQEWNLDIPQSILNYMNTKKDYLYIKGDAFTENIYIIFNTDASGYWNSGTTIWLMKIDKNKNASSYSLVNNTGKNIRFLKNNFVFNGNYMWISDYSEKRLLGINYTNSSQVIDTGITTAGYDKNIYQITENLLAIYNGYYASSYNSADYYNLAVYDVINNTLRPVNGYGGSSLPIIFNFVDRPATHIMTYENGGGALYLFKDPRYLATINNLASPVVKTASKTMKVTYTVTFDD